MSLEHSDGPRIILDTTGETRSLSGSGLGEAHDFSVDVVSHTDADSIEDSG